MFVDIVYRIMSWSIVIVREVVKIVKYGPKTLVRSFGYASGPFCPQQIWTAVAVNVYKLTDM